VVTIPAPDDLFGDVEPTVVEIDLRFDYEALLDVEKISIIQEQFVSGLGADMRSDTTRVLIIDHACDLEKHSNGYQKIINARTVGPVVCLLLGPPAAPAESTIGPDSPRLPGAEPGRRGGLGGTGADGREPTLVKPFALRAPVATLWVSEPYGVGWGMNQTVPSFVGAAHHANDGGYDTPVLRALLDALRIPDVFDKVIDVVGGMPEATASPGILAVLGRVDDDVLADAQVLAVDQLLRDRPNASDEAPADLVTGSLALILRDAGKIRADSDVLLPGGYLDSTLTQCRDYLADAEAKAKAMRSPRAVFGEMGALLHALRGYTVHQSPQTRGMVVRNNVMVVGSHVDTLRDQLAGEFEAIDGRRGLDVQKLNRINDLGLRSEPLPHTDAPAVVEALEHLVCGGLDRRHSIVEISRWLLGISRLLIPRGSAARIPELERVCADNVVHAMREPPVMSLNLASLPTLLAVFFCCALAGIWQPAGAPVAIAIATAAVLTSIAGAIFLATARRSLPDEGRLRNIAIGDFWILTVAAALGGVAGVLAPVQLYPFDVPTPLGIAAVTVAALGLIFWWRATWLHAIARWDAPSWVQNAIACVDDLRVLVNDVALYEWILSDSRRAAVDIAGALSGALFDMKIQFVAHADKVRTEGTGRQLRATPGVDAEIPSLLRQNSAEIAGIVSDDMVALVRLLLERCWADLGRDALDAPAQWVSEQTEMHLGRYKHHLERRGVHGLSPFKADNERRRVLAHTVWQDTRRVSTVLRSSIQHPGIIQLCAPEHLLFLDVDPNRAGSVRFAPKGAQTQHGQGLRGVGRNGDHQSVMGDMIWTEWGQVAGIIRLVRMRAGTVETILENAQ
jgi:hypothetical protein